MEKKTGPLEGLNPRQEEAVKHFTGPLLILAGAGTGKTRVITHRIAYLIEALGVVPTQILALTFTNKAAEEMRERAASLIGERAGGAMLSTFHSFCNYILRRNIHRLGGYDGGFSIYDETDARSCIKKILTAMELPVSGDFSPARIAGVISRAKNFDIDPINCVSMHEPLNDHITAISMNYEKKLRENNALDFDDLLIKTLVLFRKDKETLTRYKNRFQFILVDEYQDTNRIQYEILRELVSDDGNITVVGDLDQAIYSWRGADVGNIISYEKDFKDVVVVALEQNYRSKQRILDAANELIKSNPGIREKHLWSELGEGDPVRLHIPWDERDEASFIAREIDFLVTEGYRLDDMAVLFRARAQSRVFEDVFMKMGIPYKLINATAFYDRKEIKDIIAYLRVVENPKDIISFDRIANEPRRGIGKKSLERVEEAARMFGSLFGILDNEKSLPKGFPPKALPLIKTLKSLHESRGSMKITELVKRTSKDTGFYAALEKAEKEEGINRAENIDEFINIAAEYERMTSQPALEGFLSHVSLVADVDLEDFGEGNVRLMTLHSAKGLEFPIVFLAGVEEGILPHRTSVEERNGEFEERRLCYVGMTRAREQLYMTACRQRLRFGRVENNDISRFIEEIGRGHFEVLKSARGGPAKGESFFEDADDRAYNRIESKFTVESVELPDLDSDMDSGPGYRRRGGRGFRPGDRIEHETLGYGTIVQCKDDEIAVSFPNRPVWWLSLDSAPIRKA
ncbi:MAG: UvrD-helicase domain-containing protein [bacterium]